jgi:hypothetical protein
VIRVLSVRSLGYTGTTWLNFVLASHPQCFYLGPPDRIWSLTADKRPYACLTHRSGCRFWDDFFSTYDPARRFLPQLSAFTGGKTFIMNNPTPAFREKELSSADVELREIFLVRDGRAVINSVVRHMANEHPDFIGVMMNRVYPATKKLRLEYETKRSTSAVLRYEDMVQRPIETLVQNQSLLGHRYNRQSLHFWKFPHHPTAGNTGTNDLFRRMQGQGARDHRRKAYYDEAVERLKRDPDHRVFDLSWMTNTTRRDRVAYDTVMGDLHAYFGYEREEFSPEERQVCALELGLGANE